MEKIWFVYSNQVVTGPLDVEQVKSRLTQGEWAKDACVWWKGQREWVAIANWESQLARIIEAGTKTASPIWYLEVGDGSPQGPLTIDETLQNLRGISSLAKVRLWSAGMDEWLPIYEIPYVMDLLGISRRSNERAPLMSSVVVSRPSVGLGPVAVNASSISVGGMGLSGAHDLRRGDQCQMFVKCGEFPSGLHVHGEVVYVTVAGYAGIKFSHAHPEAQSLIYDYVRKFAAPADESVARAA